MASVTRLPSPSKHTSSSIQDSASPARTSNDALLRRSPAPLSGKPYTRLQPMDPSKSTKSGGAHSHNEFRFVAPTSNRPLLNPADRPRERTLQAFPSQLQNGHSVDSATSEMSQTTLPPTTLEADKAPEVTVTSGVVHPNSSIRSTTKSIRPVSQISKLAKPSTRSVNVAMVTNGTVSSALSTSSGTKAVPITASSAPQTIRSTSARATTTGLPMSASPRKPPPAALRTNSTPVATTTKPQALHLLATNGDRAMSSPMKAAHSPLPTKPQFTTHQRSFSPSKPSPVPPKPITSSPKVLRAQTQVLHLSLLHASAAPTFAAYTASAHSQLHSLHDTVQTIYVKVLLLERKARQAENVLALHSWAGGNVKSVGRRLNVLCSVLREVMALSAPGGRRARNVRRAPLLAPLKGRGEEAADDGDIGNADVVARSPATNDQEREEDVEEEEEDDDEEEQGPYAHLIEAFTHWTEWVSEIWRAREHEDSLSPVPIQISTTLPNTITPIDPLGDALKASLRSLTTTLSSLARKLSEIPPFPTSPTTTTTLSTPAHLLALARELISLMQEELQLIREIEFEVVVGEEAWMKRRLGALSGEVAGGFMTPIRGR